MYLKIIVFMFLSLSGFAADNAANVEVKAELMALNNLERFVLENPDMSLEAIKAKQPELLEDIKLVEDNNAITTNVMKDMPLVGGFWWGCCLGIVGLALVYFITDKDRSQVRSALWGCLLFTVLGGGIYGFWNPFGW